MLKRVIICALLIAAMCLSQSFVTEAAVSPNGQPGACGQYYLWYQIGPNSYSSPTDYVDLCGITFDLSDVVDDFDLVSFTDTSKLQRASLDEDRDGISDQYFFKRSENQLQWKPPYGCVRITQRGCWGSKFDNQCGYAMISVQPKTGFRNGSARIPVSVQAKCSPNGYECGETCVIVHTYSACATPSVSDFIVQNRTQTTLITTNKQSISFTAIVQNTQISAKSTFLTIMVDAGTNGGTLLLSSINVSCPSEAACKIMETSDNRIVVSLADVPGNFPIEIAYNMKANSEEIEKDMVSYFTATATLSNGESSRVTVGVSGTKIVRTEDFFQRHEQLNERPERPRK